MNATSAHGRCFPANRVFGVIAVLFAIVLIASCDSPANNSVSGSARLELRLPEAPDTVGSSRAILGSGGYLYIRAIGGPSGDVGPLWGPLSASGKSVIISDIDPGEYSNILVLHSGVEFDDTAYSLYEVVGNPVAEYTFQQIMNFTDDVLSRYLVPPPEDFVFIFKTIMAGRGSAALTGPVVIKPGVNSFALTLVPQCTGNESTMLDLSGDEYVASIDMLDRFHKIFFPEAPSWSSVYFTLNTNENDVPCAFYTSAGKRIGGIGYLPSDFTYRGSVSTSSFPLYLSVDTETMLTFGFTAYEGGVPAEIRVNGDVSEIAINSVQTFGMVNSGTPTSARAITIANDGTLPLVISSIAISGTHSENFSVTPSAPFTVPPRGSWSGSMVFTYLGGIAMTKSGIVTINSNDSNEGAYTINLSGYSS